MKTSERSSPSLTHVVRRRRGKGKSDPIDAVAVARVVAADETLPSARRTVLLADLKVLVVTNDAEPVVGAITTYRWFHVSGEQLRSIGLGDYLWVPGRNAARCHLAGQAGTKTVWLNDPEDPDGIVKTKEQRVWAHGRIPSIECTCGFYVLRDEPVLESGDAVPHRSVVCRVAIWGRAIQYTEGYRAEFAAITGLITATPRRYKAVLNAYEIPAVQARTKAEQGLTTAYLRRVNGDRVHLDVIARDSLEITGWFTVAPGVDIPDPIVEVTARFTPERSSPRFACTTTGTDEQAPRPRR